MSKKQKNQKYTDNNMLSVYHEDCPKCKSINTNSFLITYKTKMKHGYIVKNFIKIKCKNCLFEFEKAI